MPISIIPTTISGPISTAISMADYGMQELAYELNVTGARNARTAADAFMAAHPGRICWRDCRRLSGTVGCGSEYPYNH